MIDQLDGQVSWFDQDSWSLKTCQEQSVPVHQRARTSGSSLKKSQKSANQMPLFLDLRETGNGQDVSWDSTGVLLGKFMTRNGGVFHSVESGCVSYVISTDTQHRTYYLTLNCGEKPRIPNPTHLSDILERNSEATRRFMLSAKACEGILRRAERRGKELPSELKQALISQIEFYKDNGTEVESCDTED